MKFDVISDPGHGWIKVPKKLLVGLGIADKITPYSYMRGDFAYLEEDCDAGTFMKAMAEQRPDVQVEQRLRTCYERPSRVRNYSSYKAEAASAD